MKLLDLDRGSQREYGAAAHIQLVGFVSSAVLATMALFEEALSAIGAPAATFDGLSLLLKQRENASGKTSERW